MGSTEKGQAVIGRQQSPGMRAAKFIFHSGVAAYMISAYRALSVITERVVTEEVSSHTLRIGPELTAGWRRPPVPDHLGVSSSTEPIAAFPVTKVELREEGGSQWGTAGCSSSVS